MHQYAKICKIGETFAEISQVFNFSRWWLAEIFD